MAALTSRERARFTVRAGLVLADVDGVRELPEMIEEALLRACGDRLRVRVGSETA